MKIKGRPLGIPIIRKSKSNKTIISNSSLGSSNYKIDSKGYTSYKTGALFKTSDKIQPLDNKGGDEHWISLSIKSRSQEVLKDQMAKHINKMRVLRFDFKE